MSFSSEMALMKEGQPFQSGQVRIKAPKSIMVMGLA